MKKLIYLISPEKIYSDFYKDLNKVLETRKIKFFQLRLKKISKNKTIKIAKKIMKITKIHKVNFLINDSFKIAKIINADGCHLGQLDGSVINAKKSLKNKKVPFLEFKTKLFHSDFKSFEYIFRE